MNTPESLAAAIGERKLVATAKLLTQIERRTDLGYETLRLLAPTMGKAQVIGITGSPGSGKSTLTDQLIGWYRKQGHRVGVIAVDPSSPFTGGAILGDRIRMQRRSTDPDVFIRSMGTRGNLGGLSSSTADAVRALDAAGYDRILVETVGVGQAEVDVVRLADTVVVVLVPGMGDDVQAVKAGVMEIADVFCINKADLIGADKVEGEVGAMMSLGHPDEDDFWWQPICKTIAERGEGIEDLTTAVAKHHEWATRTGAMEVRRHKRFLHQTRDLLGRALVDFAFASNGEPNERFAVEIREIEQSGMGAIAASELILRAYQADA